MWAVGTSDDFDRWFGSMRPAIQSEVIAKVELLKVLGPALKRPHADTLNGSRHPNM